MPKLLVFLLVPCAALASGSIAGTVGFTGAAPRLPKLQLSDPMCKAANAEDPSVQLSKDGKALANVVVRISQGAKAGGAAPAGPVVITQQGCMYHPHVLAAMSGQKVEVKNADETVHNVHASAKPQGKETTLFNVVQPPGAKEIEKDPKALDVVKLKCDIHPWMAAYVVYSEHPYFAVSDETGAFEIKGVPPGEYTVEAWHERFGTRTATVTVADGQPVDPKLSFSDRK